MISRCLSLAAASALFIHLAGCERQSPAPAATETVEGAVPAQVPSAAPSFAPPPAALDEGALGERKEPERVLRYYADALAARNWAAAARAWGANSGVTAKTLETSYNQAEAPVLTFAKGEQDGGAGSLYYEVPVTLRFGPAGTAQRGMLTLRRVNDVDGATPEQLRWHIERSTIGGALPPP